jgi:hypothetical protein
MNSLPPFKKFDSGKVAPPSPYAGVVPGKQNKKVEGWLSKEKSPMMKRVARSASEDSEYGIEAELEVKDEVKSEVKVENKAVIVAAADSAEVKEEPKPKTGTKSA